MKRCDSCGGPLTNGHPFALCPKCLFGAALHAHDAGGSTGSYRLSPRADFFAKYDILEKVAGGGQGEVWKAWDFEFHRCVAMKRMAEHASDKPPAVHRFLAEAQIASQLEHPGILPIFDVGLDPDGRPFYTTQLLAGETLEAVWRQIHAGGKSPWTIPRALELLLRVCDTMSHAHSRGVIHRDLKPANILVGAFGDVRVVDWGSAHVLASAQPQFEAAFVPLPSPAIATDRARAMRGHPDSPLSTASSGQPLTLVFTPPEIIAGDAAELGPATDIYALGVMLYQLLARVPPYHLPDGKPRDKEELKRLILRGPPAPVRTVNPRASRDLAAISEKAMAYQRRARYATMSELAEDIRAALETRPVQARRPGVLLKLQKWSQRNYAHVLLAGGALLLLLVALSAAQGFKAQRDAARQAALVRNAELAARGGRWREALNFWQAAAAAGYRDKVYLGLQTAEALTILSEPEQARARLLALARRGDLGARRGAVWLRLGEHELFDEATASQGVNDVRAALAYGLEPADKLFARGLLADTSPAALDLFHQALQIDSFHHGAHRHSLGLEFLLGRHADLQASIRFFQAVYPDDPSASFLEVSELAMQGELEAARAKMAERRHPADELAWQKVARALPRLAAVAQRFDPQTWLAASSSTLPKLDLLVAGEATTTGGPEPGKMEASRTPYLPCIQNGLLEGRAAIGALMVPFIGNVDTATARIEAAWRHHPEALIPVVAGLYLENRQPTNGFKSAHLLALQSELFQLAADSPSLFRNLNRAARFLAAKTGCELWQLNPTNAAAWRQSCVRDLRQAWSDPDISVAELSAYDDLAMKLGERELARQFVFLWGERQPNAPALLQARLDWEMADGNLGAAWNLANQILAASPHDAPAQADQQTLKSMLARLNALINTNSESTRP